MDISRDVIDWLLLNAPSLIIFGGFMWVVHQFALPFYRSFLSARENSVKNLKKQIEACNVQYEELKRQHREEIEIERRKVAELMAQNDQLIGIYIGVNAHLESLNIPKIPLPKWVEERIKILDNG